MPLTQEDMQTITALIGGTVQAVLAAQRDEGRATRPTRGEAVEERFYRKINQFGGENWKDWCFQFKSATRGSSSIAYDLLNWAEKETSVIDDFTEFEGGEDQAIKISGELFNVISTMVQGEALQLLHNCDYNGAEAWRRLSRRYSPSTPLRAMQLMLQIVSPGKAKSVKELPNIIDKWESRVLALQRDFKETISSRMKAAILISILPSDIQDALIQQADKYEEYLPTKEKVLSIVDAKMAMRSPDEMDVDALHGHGGASCDDCHYEEEIGAVGKGGIYCYRCGGQGHIAAKCATPEPAKGKGKGGKDGKGFKGGGKGGKGGKGDWNGYCSYCGKKGHGPRNCWTKEKDEANGIMKNDLGAVEGEMEEQYSLDRELGGFDVACIEMAENRDDWETMRNKRRKNKLIIKPKCGCDICAVEVNQAKTIGKGKITIDSGAAESVIPQGMLNEIKVQESEGSRNGVQYIAANGAKMPNLGEKKVFFKTKDGMESNVVFQVTHARKPLASVSKIVKKGNKVIFSPSGSYIENIDTGKKIELNEANGTYHMDVEYLAKDFTRRD